VSKVYISRCETYEYERVEEAVRVAINALGGMGQFVQCGQRVLLKPNLLRSSTPGEAIITHPTIVRALVVLVQEVGAQAVIGDSPGVPYGTAGMRSFYAKAGLMAVAEETGAELIYSSTAVQLPHPSGELIKMVDAMEIVTQVDSIISLPKLKTHGLTGFTGATKNLFGLVPGLVKIGYHAKLQTAEQFSEMLIDLLQFHKPVLTVMDAVVGMEGNGPSGGDPRQLGLLLVAKDGIALDLVATSMVGIGPQSVAPLRVAIRRGLTTGDVADVNVLGVPLDDARVPDFRPHDAVASAEHATMPALARRFLARQLVTDPLVGPNCTGCGTCVKTCPTGAATMEGERATIDLGKCIRCYCCHEMCPENAVVLKRSLLASLLGRL
jgi:uncharacterized protein (DUF362 family)/NAD-dependent dihydropyrimidine dehydrogenase PreA subunit